jgi:hypothetical protein
VALAAPPNKWVEVVVWKKGRERERERSKMRRRQK